MDIAVNYFRAARHLIRPPRVDELERRRPDLRECWLGSRSLGGRFLRESREPALHVLFLLDTRHFQIVAQLVFSFIYSTTPKQDLGEEQPGIGELKLSLTQHFHGFERVAFLRG